MGVYVGSTIHEVAQVIAASRAIGPEAMDSAVIAKMVRVLMLAPFLVALSSWEVRDNVCRGSNAARHPSSNSTGRRIAIPWFAFGFIAVVLLNSLKLLPSDLVRLAIDVDTALLATAMSALGLTSNLGEIRKAGSRPLALALVLFAWLVLGGALVNQWAAS